MLKKLSLYSIFLLMLIFANGAKKALAGIDYSISPVRINLYNKPKRKYKDVVYVYNNSDTRAIFSVNTKNLVMDEDGRFRDETDLSKVPNALNDYISYRPRRFSLEAGKAQAIKIRLVRRSGIKEDGEYRVNLQFSKKDIVIPVDPVTEEVPSEGLSINLEPKFNISIPVIYHHGKTSVGLKVNNVKLAGNNLKLDTTRTGNISLHSSCEITNAKNGKKIYKTLFVGNTIKNVKFDVAIPKGYNVSRGSKIVFKCRPVVGNSKETSKVIYSKVQIVR